ncbi:protein phosphatase 1 regulatory subunit 1B isoform X1 [Grus americana]|uniref:protein phosphatase 1 regulatory subunit 1B isoform X1 n=1 Tax=Grus americana TaxID=9117 RepID=UPI0024083E07|nr:protein phosphatase 1 regulatory subunit 1B isoform X1 [Grus americana]
MGTGMPEPRGCGDVGTGLLKPRGHGDRIARAWGMWGHGDKSARATGTWGWSCRSPGVQRRMPPFPAALGDGVGARGVGGHTQTQAGSCRCCLDMLSAHPGLSGARGDHHVPPPGSVSVPRRGHAEGSQTPGRSADAAVAGSGGAPVPYVPSSAPGSSPPAREAPGSQARAERSFFPAGPKAHKRRGGQKVSFAGGIEERDEDLKSLTVSEIPEDPEGPEGDEEEAGREQEDGGTGERRHVGFAEVPSRPIGTERHSPTFPLGTS